jgi:hypothetical protein
MFASDSQPRQQLCILRELLQRSQQVSISEIYESCCG